MTVAADTCIQFVKGTNETSVPDVKLTRSKDGTNGTAFFWFSEPDVFEATELEGEITGMFLIDQEGELSTVDVNAKFLNGKPQGIEATYVDHRGLEPVHAVHGVVRGGQRDWGSARRSAEARRSP